MASMLTRVLIHPNILLALLSFSRDYHAPYIRVLPKEQGLLLEYEPKPHTCSENCTRVVLGITCVLYHCTMCTRHPDLVFFAFYAIALLYILLCRIFTFTCRIKVLKCKWDEGGREGGEGTLIPQGGRLLTQCASSTTKCFLYTKLKSICSSVS